jgi:hypothetical protein
LSLALPCLSLCFLSCVLSLSLVLLILARVCCVWCVCRLSEHSPEHCESKSVHTLSPLPAQPAALSRLTCSHIVSSDLLSSLACSPCLLSQASRRKPRRLPVSPSLVCRALSHASIFLIARLLCLSLVLVPRLELAHTANGTRTLPRDSGHLALGSSSRPLRSFLSFPFASLLFLLFLFIDRLQLVIFPSLRPSLSPSLSSSTGRPPPGMYVNADVRRTMPRTSH